MLYPTLDRNIGSRSRVAEGGGGGFAAGAATAAAGMATAAALSQAAKGPMEKLTDYLGWLMDQVQEWLYPPGVVTPAGIQITPSTGWTQGTVCAVEPGSNCLSCPGVGPDRYQFQAATGPSGLGCNICNQSVLANSAPAAYGPGIRRVIVWFANKTQSGCSGRYRFHTEYWRTVATQGTVTGYRPKAQAQAAASTPAIPKEDEDDPATHWSRLRAYGLRPLRWYGTPRPMPVWLLPTISVLDWAAGWPERSHRGNRPPALDSALTDAEYLTEDRADDDDTPASEMAEMQRKWEFMRAVGMTEMDYDQFLKTFGIKGETSEPHRPELLRYVREWSYPTNTIDPTDGDPASAMSWSVRDRIDKDRFFKEHGFIVGVSVARPKVYLKGQTASAVTMMDTAFSWLPAIMRDEAYTSLKKIASGQAPLKSVSSAYWVDIRDLFLYGDQFLNYAMTDTASNIVAAPTTGLEKRYPTNAELDAMFVDAAGGNNLVRQDGVITFSILGTQIDQTPKSAGYA